MERCPTQAVLPLVGLAAQKVIRDRYNLECQRFRKASGSIGPDRPSMIADTNPSLFFTTARKVQASKPRVETAPLPNTGKREMIRAGANAVTAPLGKRPTTLTFTTLTITFTRGPRE
ncbi:MAG: hypothetical protein R6U98_18105 [Pirellulaceae bacterium]